MTDDDRFDDADARASWRYTAGALYAVLAYAVGSISLDPFLTVLVMVGIPLVVVAWAQSLRADRRARRGVDL